MSSPGSDRQVVIGLGRSGIGAARLLQAQGHAVLLLEQNDSAVLQQRAAELRAEGIDVTLGCDLTAPELPGLSGQPKRVVVSPGMRWNHPLLLQLRERGVTVHGELIPAWEASTAVPWIGITGTNGKTTVTHLVSHLLNSAGIDAPMGGNVGHSAAELVLQRCLNNPAPPQWLVIEISSYQIEAAAALAPQIGIWTTLTPDHLERHGTVDAYRAIKRSLLERSGLRILNADDPDLRAHASSWDQACWVSAQPRSTLPEAIEASFWIENNQIWQNRHGQARALMAADCLAMPGAHNRQNMVMAVAAGVAAGLSAGQMEQALASFPGVPHRLERLAKPGAICFYNDSKATNYDAAEVALSALDGPLVVLAGGEAKIGDASGWIAALKAKAKAVVLYGAAQQQFETLLQQGGFAGTIALTPSLNEAVPLASSLAQQLECQAVLLSPACASFDQYSDFEARGEHFRELVNAL